MAYMVRTSLFQQSSHSYVDSKISKKLRRMSRAHSWLLLGVNTLKAVQGPLCLPNLEGFGNYCLDLGSRTSVKLLHLRAASAKTGRLVSSPGWLNVVNQDLNLTEFRRDNRFVLASWGGTRLPGVLDSSRLQLRSWMSAVTRLTSLSPHCLALIVPDRTPHRSLIDPVNCSLYLWLAIVSGLLTSATHLEAAAS